MAPVEEPANDFGQVLESLIGNKYKTSKVSEEELYAALIVYQIKQRYSEQDAKDYTALFKFSMADRDRNSEPLASSAERSANEVMDKFFSKDSIIIPAKEAKEIKETAFRLAQLDDNRDSLWDQFGGGSDKTVSVTSFARAQHLMQKRLNAEEAKSASAVRRSAKAKKLSQLG